MVSSGHDPITGANGVVSSHLRRQLSLELEAGSRIAGEVVGGAGVPSDGGVEMKRDPIKKRQVLPIHKL